jgi:phosphatidate cytidylyltransferase
MRKINFKKLITRLLTIALLAPIVIGLISFDMQPYGSLPFLVFIISVAVMSLNEFYHMAYQKEEPFFLTGHFLSITLIMLAFISELRGFWHSIPVWLTAFMFLCFFLFELSVRRIYFPARKLAITFRGVIYIGLFYSFFILIRNLPFGKELVFSVLFTIWSLDIMAYLVGMTFGKHKLSPDISPKKTLEGAVGGFCAAVFMSFILSSGVLQDAFPSSVNRFFAIHIGIWHSLVLGAIIGILGQTGDLYESLIKRTYHVKDSSNILPGHGGILDRADSFILLAPVVYYYLAWLLL